ncbi:probable carbohydrate esterase At4g34215 [Beta vulgaris subsp. vulgaris]|uniref:probable carbohydrate esterase At4g34215 n=1 Tax=Beta vulgaris subsp. vulgaris TaxID=3555 RepID=UPI002036D505|nr:probable carbohydrate esterase At4g34215 [Beta vulgaris subsp. vulgaris]
MGNIPSYLCCIFLLSYLSHPTHATRSSDKTIILLAGQSNMAGRGGVINERWDGLVPDQYGATPSILRLNAKHQWVVATEPLHRDIDTYHTCGVGPGMSLAHTVVRRALSIGTVGLVPCAVGGTNISQWSRGSHLYNQLLKRAWASLRDGGTIQALVWYQGESDTLFKQTAEAYKRRLLQFFLDFRTDLQSPMLPIIQVAITSGEGRFIEEVRQAQMEVDLLNFETVDAKGLPLEPDNLHLTTPAQVQLGEKLAHTFLQFLPGQVQSNAGSFLVSNDAGSLLQNNRFYTSLTALLLIFLRLQ